MRLDGLLGEVQLPGDLAVAGPPSEEREDVGLAAGEAGVGEGLAGLGVVGLSGAIEEVAHGAGGQDVSRPGEGDEDGLGEVLGRGVLEEVSGGSLRQGGLHVLAIVEAGQDDHGQRRPGRTDLAEELDPVAPRHPDVYERDVVRGAGEDLHRLVRVRGLRDLRVADDAAEDLGEAFADQRVVVHEQNLHGLALLLTGTPRSGGGRSPSCRGRDGTRCGASRRRRGRAAGASPDRCDGPHGQPARHAA